MTDQSGMQGAPVAASPAGVTLHLSLEPPEQRRWTILIRWILALPLAFAAIGIYLAALVWLIGAWFAALFTGRVPNALQHKLCGVLQFQARLSAYTNLLTDVWPGVHFQARADDPVTLDVDHVDLRRSAVVFRLILAFPAVVLASIVGTGVYLFLFVMWVVGLFRGRTPKALHQVAALTIRYTIRSAAFWAMMTPTQPFLGFFGDGVAGADASAPATLVTTDSSAHRSTTWLVEPAVKALLIVVIVLGVLGQGTNNRWHGGVKWDLPTHSERTVVVNATDAASMEQARVGIQS